MPSGENIASQLSPSLDREQSSSNIAKEARVREFLLQLLQTVKQRPYPPVIYPLLRANLDNVSLELVRLLQIWVKETLLKLNPNQLRGEVITIYDFSVLIQDFPFKCAESIEIAIAGYEIVGQVFTRESSPQAWATTQNSLANAYSKRIQGERAENIEVAIAAYEQALTVMTQTAMPVDWAAILNNLAIAYKNRIRGERAENIEVAIAAYEQALTVMTQTAMPVEWAATLNNLATAYLDRIRGERAENIEVAIAAYKQALTVRTPSAMPVAWAETLNNLANAYRDRIQGERAENIEVAIATYKQALEVRTQSAMPVAWAQTLNNLAIAYSNRIRGERAENIEVAIAAYEQALKVMTPSAMPVAWAQTLNNLAIAYSNRIQGNCEENIEQAIAAYELALEVRTQSAMPIAWAETLNNLANAYRDRIQGERAENIEVAIATYKQALEVRTQSAMPVAWAQTIMGLATAYRDRIQGNREENIEQAIVTYKQALKVRTQSAMPIAWAETLNNLANAYRDRIQGERAENIEQAIAACKQALEVRTKSAMPVQWTATAMDLATAYLERIQGDRVENIERAITLYEQALAVMTQTVMPIEWAATLNNFATAYLDRIRGERAENIEQAIAACKQALKVRTKSAMPVAWAQTLNNLAIAYSNRIQGNREENIEQAIAAYELALTVRTQSAMPIDWAKTLHNLATAYLARIRGNREENIEQAIAAYELALTVRTQSAMPIDWATTLHNLATAYLTRIRGNREENIEQAIAACEQTLTIFPPDKLPNDCRRTARLLANLYANNHLWTEASEPYTLAITAAENLYAASLFRSSQEAELKETNDLYRRAAYAYAKTDDLPKAMTTLEQGRARGLSETLQRDRADLEQVKQSNLELYERYQAAANALSQLESSERTLGADPNRPQLTPEDLRQQATRIRNDLQACLSEIRQIPGYENFLALPTFEEIVRSVRPNNPLVYLLVTPSGSLALILQIETPEASPTIQSIGLDKLTEENLIQLLKTWFDADRQNKTAYSEYARNRNSQTEQAFIQAQQDWHQTIDRTTEQLWTPVMEPIIQYLLQHHLTQATLIPTGYLSLLPLHAAWMEDPTTPTGRRYALDTICFTYAPNARSLHTAQTIAQQTPVTNLLAIDNPTQDLSSSCLEVAAATASFPQHQTFEHQQATRTAVRDALKTHSVLHFSCHGTANFRDPLNSGLRMADELLTLRDLFDLKLQGIRLALFSACETGIPGINLPDEVVSLPVGLLQAGVAGVVASLWSVSDLSTMLLLTRFYDFWRKDALEPTEALRQAQMWVRDTTNQQKAKYFKGIDRDLARKLLYEEPKSFAHPFYWSAFTYTGV